MPPEVRVYCSVLPGDFLEVSKMSDVWGGSGPIPAGAWAYVHLCSEDPDEHGQRAVALSEANIRELRDTLTRMLGDQ